METTALQKKREKYATALDVAFRKILTMLRAMPEVQQVILFGSYGKGRRDLFTDIDLLVIMESDEKFIDRTARVYSQIQAGVDKKQ
jgi:predicted nucleotidyltransferase